MGRLVSARCHALGRGLFRVRSVPRARIARRDPFGMLLQWDREHADDDAGGLRDLFK